MSNGTQTSRVKKKVYIPSSGDFLTDGTRLVEVRGKCREGYEVIDATVSVEDEEPVEVLNAEVVSRTWRQVKVGGE